LAVASLEVGAQRISGLSQANQKSLARDQSVRPVSGSASRAYFLANNSSEGKAEILARIFMTQGPESPYFHTVVFELEAPKSTPKK
jgi:hypothetical protein